MEARFAEWCDAVKTEWEYEPETLMLSNGIQYTPDFILPTCSTIVEVKPAIFLKETQHKMDALASAKELLDFRLVVLEMKHKSAWGENKEWPRQIKMSSHIPKILKSCMSEAECEHPDEKPQGPLRSFTDTPDEMCFFFCFACRAPNVTSRERWVLDMLESEGNRGFCLDVRCLECGQPQRALSGESDSSDWLFGAPHWPMEGSAFDYDRWEFECSLGENCKRARTP